jgi:hypothetical protein
MTGMTPLEVLIAARSLISDPARWTRDAYARTAGGCEIRDSHPDAASWCASGAIWRTVTGAVEDGLFAWSEERSHAIHAAHALLSKAAGQRGIKDTNDNGTHAEVLAMFDRAIQLARSGQ